MLTNIILFLFPVENNSGSMEKPHLLPKMYFIV